MPFILERMCYGSELRRINTRVELAQVLFRKPYNLWLKADKIVACLKGIYTFLNYQRKINRLKEAMFSLTLRSLTFLPLTLRTHFKFQAPVLFLAHSLGKT